jgi:tetratricopeptide (TPR) repeat protein
VTTLAAAALAVAGFASPDAPNALCLAGIVTLAQPLDPYVATLREYLAGDPNTALTRLLNMDAVDVSIGARALAQSGDLRLLYAAAAIHTEAALQNHDDFGMISTDWQLQLARDIVQYGELHAKPRSGGIDLTKSRLPPVRTSFRRAWYVLAIRHYESWGRLPQTEHLLERTRELYASDPELLLLDAIADEANASPRMPALTPTQRAGRLRDAQRKLRVSLELNPNATEARLRYGRVLQQLGYSAEARRAFVGLPTSSDPRVRYLSTLFMGSLTDTLGDPDDAALWYQAAIDTIPGQSAIVARSELFHRAGSLDAADATLHAILQGPDDRDPWWSYAFGQFWLIDASRAQLRALARQ